jgi:hypothetical protein
MHDHFDHKYERTTFSIEHELSELNDTDTSANYPAISSMEVEISMVADSPPLSASHHPTSPYQHENPMSPQRASQVFGFLTERRRSCIPQDSQGPPPLPSLLAPSALALSCVSRFSDSSTEYDSSQHEKQSMSQAVLEDNQFVSLDAFPSRRSWSGDDARLASHNNNDDYDSSSYSPVVYRRSVSSLKVSNADTPESAPQVKVVITEPTPASENNPIKQIAADETVPQGPIHGPRGPRPRFSHSSAKFKHYEDGPDHKTEYPTTAPRAALVERPQNAKAEDVLPKRDPFTPLPARWSKAQRRTISITSTLSLAHDSDVLDAPGIMAGPDLSLTARAAPKQTWAQRPREWPIVSGKRELEKENCGIAGAPVNRDALLVTPVRTHSQTVLGIQPSPASSSELSPVGQQMMMNLRLQRMRAREAERLRERNGGRRSLRLV